MVLTWCRIHWNHNYPITYSHLILPHLLSFKIWNQISWSLITSPDLIKANLANLFYAGLYCWLPPSDLVNSNLSKAVPVQGVPAGSHQSLSCSCAGCPCWLSSSDIIKDYLVPVQGVPAGTHLLNSSKLILPKLFCLQGVSAGSHHLPSKGWDGLVPHGIAYHEALSFAPQVVKNSATRFGIFSS